MRKYLFARLGAFVFMSIAAALPANAQPTPSQGVAGAPRPAPRYTSTDYRFFLMDLENAFRGRKFELPELRYERLIANPVRTTDGTWLMEAITTALDNYY